MSSRICKEGSQFNIPIVNCHKYSHRDLFHTDDQLTDQHSLATDNDDDDFCTGGHKTDRQSLAVG